jgi:Ca2+-binding EF-hand superfamily protein
LPGPPAAETIVPVDGSVSKAEFERMVAQFGGSGAAADQLFATFDTNDDGSISHGEFLAGLAKVNDDGGNTAFAQTLGELMDDHGNHNGTVDSSEFGAFDAAFVNAEKLAVANDDAPPKPDLTT